MSTYCLGAFKHKKAKLGAYSVITNLRVDLCLKLYGRFQLSTSSTISASQQPATNSCKHKSWEVGKEGFCIWSPETGGRCLFNIFRLQKHISKHWMDPFSEEEFGLHTGTDKNSFELENNKKFGFHIRCMYLNILYYQDHNPHRIFLQPTQPPQNR